MAEKLKRGGPFPDGFEQGEARLLGPYPTWKRWRHVLEKRFNLSFKDSHCAEPFLHQFYRLRRLQQKVKRIDQEEVNEFWQTVEREMPDFERGYGEMIEFMIEKMPVKKMPVERPRL